MEIAINRLLIITAKILSYLFHPLLILTYALILLLMANPYLFGVNDMKDSFKFVVLVFISSFFIPLVAVILMKFIGLVQTFQLSGAKERIGPYIATGIFYLWMFRNFLDNPDVPKAFTGFVLGALIGLFTAFIINNFSKISMHAVGMGGFVAMVITIFLFYDYGSLIFKTQKYGTLQINMLLVVIFSILIAGAVSTSRLLLKAHTRQEIWGGLFIGLCSQIIALRIGTMLNW